MAAHAAGRPLPRHYAHPDIRLALAVETASKCAYCESRVRHVAPENVEHIIAKSRRPDLAVEWTNLTIACPNCNRYKSDYYSDNLPLLNPYTDDPDAHLLFEGAVVLGETPRGRVTVVRLRLSRVGLLEERAERLTTLHGIVRQWQDEARSDVKAVLWEEISAFIGPAREYSASLRAHLMSHVVVPGVEVPEDTNST